MIHKKAREGIEPPSTESESVVMTATLTGQLLNTNIKSFGILQAPLPASAANNLNAPQKTALEGVVFRTFLYGCESWSLKKQQLDRLQMFDDR